MSAKWTIQIMRIIGQLRLILMDMGHRLMNYTTQLISKMISNFNLIHPKIIKSMSIYSIINEIRY
jgi:hypothetical protein